MTDVSTWRLIPSRFPPIQTFEQVASAADLEAVMEVEGWTNDRLVATRLARLPRDLWVWGRPNASVVMAAFLHASPAGGRFSGGDLGAWYCGLSERTAIAEVCHHLRREANLSGVTELRGEFRCYQADISEGVVDIRGQISARPDLYHPSDWSSSQAFGESVRSSGRCGIVYDSLRHRGGQNIVAYDTKKIDPVTIGSHFQLLVPITGKVIARRLPA